MQNIEAGNFISLDECLQRSSYPTFEISLFDQKCRQPKTIVFGQDRKVTVEFSKFVELNESDTK